MTAQTTGHSTTNEHLVEKDIVPEANDDLKCDKDSMEKVKVKQYDHLTNRENLSETEEVVIYTRTTQDTNSDTDSMEKLKGKQSDHFTTAERPSEVEISTKTTDDTNSDADSVENIYENFEPEDLYDLDLVSGKCLLPLNNQCQERYKEYTKHGMFSTFDREHIEQKVEKMKQDFLQAILSTEFEHYFTPEDEWLAKGSSAEGSLFPSAFGFDREHFSKEVLGTEPMNTDVAQLDDFINKHKPDGHENYFSWAPDMDIMISPSLLWVPAEAHCRSTNYTGYFELVIDKGSQIGKWESCLKTNETKTQHSILSPHKVKQIFYQSLCVLRQHFGKANETLIIVPHGLAYQATVVSYEDKAFYASLYDLALGIRCKFWPRCALEWITRKRIWPDKGEVTGIAAGVDMMIKSPTGKVSDMLWRISFARAEYAIARLPLVYWYASSPHSQMKNFLQSLNHSTRPKVINSYHIKTLFLYALERLPPDCWINGEQRLRMILYILDQLIVCLATHQCKHYFMPQVNLLHSISNPIHPDFFPTVAQQLVDKRSKLMENPTKYFLE